MAATIADVLQNALKEISSLTCKPEDFLTAQDSSASKFSKTLKTLYDSVKQDEQFTKESSALPKLIVDNFDDEQIWQELELQNDVCVSKLLANVAKLSTQPSSVTFQPQKIHISPDSKIISSRQQETLKQDLNNSAENIDPSEEEQDDNSESSDAELEKIKSRVATDDDDKFFDFTGDSDDDLNFDFGPIGGNTDDDLSSEEDDQKQKGRVKTDRNESIGKKQKTKEKKKKKSSIVDDAFFKLSEMEEFLVQEDTKEERRIRHEKNGKVSESDEEEEEDIDMFADIPSDEEEDLHYENFFDPPTGSVRDRGSKKSEEQQKDGEDEDHNSEEDEEEDEEEEEEDISEDDEVLEEGSEDEGEDTRQRQQKDLLADSDSEGEDVTDILGGGRKQNKSSFEQRQEKLKKKITQMEAESLAEKPWQLTGEVTASNRPENSLLSENLQFEHNTRLAPEITEETTKTLEDLIRQRIKDKAWDDVERKVKPTENPFEYKKRITLDQEKSKQSLGEIYEQEYLKQQQIEEEEKTDPNHEVIKNRMQKLFLKLDALSNFHYTPKPAAPEVKIISNMASINMEEVAPVSVSDAKLLAPQEVQEKSKVEVKGATEKTKTDKDRERRKKKLEKRERIKEKKKRQKLIEKLNPGLGNKYSKEKAMKQLERDSKRDKSGVSIIKDTKEKTGLTSSTKFFKQLQDEVTAQIKSKKAEKRKKQLADSSSAKKFKL